MEQQPSRRRVTMCDALSQPAPQIADMEFDQLSGRTIHPDNPWIQHIKKRKPTNVPAAQTSPIAHVRRPPATPPSKTAARDPPPRLPTSNYTIIYRPRAGLNLARLTTTPLTEAFAAKCELDLPSFYKKVTLLVQPTQNVIVASTPDPDLAITLSNIQTLQISTGLCEFAAYMKPPPGTCRGVIHGLEATITDSNLHDYLLGNEPALIHARFMGQTRSVLLTFQGNHVPFYVKVGSVLHRCRPFRRCVQVCRVCGELGHRMDVCPQPEDSKCPDCGQSSPAKDHACQPTCKLCSQPHTTAGKDCPRRFRPTVPTNKTRPLADNQVSWSAVAARSPTAHSSLQRDTPNFPPLPTSSHSLPLSLPVPQPLRDLIKQLQEQNAKLLSRVEALEAERAALPHPPPPATEAPTPFTRAQVEEIVNTQITAHIVPYVEQYIEKSTASLTKMITEAADATLRLLTERFSALEQTLLLEHPPQAKKQKGQNDP